MEDEYTQCINEFSSLAIWQGLDRLYSYYKHTYEFLSDGAKIEADSASFVKCAPTVPRLATGPSDEAPKISKAAKIAYDPKLGRHLIADRDIQPGEILVCEEPYAAVLTAEGRKTHCSFCLKRAPVLVPCNLCSLAYFCDESCRIQGWDKFHGIECVAARQFLSIITNEEDVDGEDILLAIRVISTVGLDNLKPFIHEGDTVADNFGFIDGKYLPNFNAIYHLVTNIARVPSEHLRTSCTVSLHLTRCFKVPDTYAAIFLRIILALDSNTHSMIEMTKKDKGFAFKVTGCAIYPSAALCNHSCDPNLFRATHGSSTVHRARRFIRKGEILTECYNNLFIHSPLVQRRRYCRHFYFFECGCEACEKDWPEMDDLPEQPPFEKGETILFTKFKQMLRDVEALPDTELVTKDEELEVIIGMLNLLASNDKRLCQLYFNLERKMMNYYYAQGNCNFKTTD